MDKLAPKIYRTTNYLLTIKLWWIEEISRSGLIPILNGMHKQKQTRTKSHLLGYSYSVLFNDESLISFNSANGHGICSKSHSSLLIRLDSTRLFHHL